MSIPRKHHFVPKSYLKRFVLPDETVHYAWKESKIISSTSAKKLCSEIDGYRLVSVPEEDALLLETNYKNLWEDQYDEVYSTLVDDQVCTIDARLRQLVVGTVCSLLFRSPRIRNAVDGLMRQVIDFSANARRLDGSRLETAEIGGRIYQLEGKSADQLWDEYQSTTNNDALLTTQFVMGVRLQQVRSRDAISVTRVRGTSGFLTSDNPTRIHPSTPGIVAPFNTTDVFTLPLNEEYRVELIPGIPAVEQDRIYRNELVGQEAIDEVLDNNVRQFAEAERMILGRRDGLEHHLRREVH